MDFAVHTSRIINRMGQPVTLTPAGGAARVVNAVFSSTPADAFGIVGGISPTLRVAAADSNDIAVGDAVTYGSISYLVAEVMDDSADAGDRLLLLK